MCDSKFAANRELLTHIDGVHLHLKPHICPTCNLTFSLKSNLQVHIDSTHLGLKPHKCPECDQRFAQKVNIKQHIRRNHTPAGIQRRKKQEQRIATLLESEGIPFTREHCVTFACVSDREGHFARIDFVLDHVPGCLVFLEVDEGGHRFGQY